MLWIKKKSNIRSKSKKKTKTETKSKSESKKTHAKNITKFIDPAFRLVLKSIVDSFSKIYPSEDVIKALKILEFEIFKYKKQTISALTELPSISDREKIWDKVKELFVEILLPMITIMNTNIASNLTKNKEVKEEKDEDIPLEIPNIGIVSRQSAKDVATVKSRLIAPNSEKTLVHTITIVDTGSDTSLVSKNIVKRLDMEIDNTNAPKLSGVATKTETIGTVYGLGILYMMMKTPILLKMTLWLLIQIRTLCCLAYLGLTVQKQLLILIVEYCKFLFHREKVLLFPFHYIGKRLMLLL